MASLVFTKGKCLPVIATVWLIGFPVGTSQGGKSTVSVLRQDAEIVRRVQQDVNMLIKVTVFCEFEG